MSDMLSKELAVKYKLSRDLEISEFPNCTVFPLEQSTSGLSSLSYGGIQSEDGNFISQSLTKRVSPKYTEIKFTDWFTTTTNNEVAIEDNLEKEAVFLGAIPKHYGHFITEGMSRLWYLLDREIDDKELIYISEEGDDFFFELFEIFGIASKNLKRINEPTRFSRIIIPEPSIRLHDYYHDLFNQTIQRVVDSVAKTKVSNIYISKKQRFNGRAIGERVIENIFRHNGFEILYPEQVPLKDFISILNSAKTVVSSSGTSAHNALFMRENSKLICLNRSDHHHPLQIMINEMRNINSVYIDSHRNFLDSDFSSGPFNLYPTIYLRNYLRDQDYLTFSLLDYLKAIFSTILYVLYFYLLGRLLKGFVRVKKLTKKSY